MIAASTILGRDTADVLHSAVLLYILIWMMLHDYRHRRK